MLAAQHDLLGAIGVVKPQQVKADVTAIRFRCALRLDAAQPLRRLHMRILRLQRPRRGQGRRHKGLAECAVVNSSGDQRPIGVAVDKLDDDLVPDAGRKLETPLGAGPVFGDTDPGGGLAVLVVIGRAVPGKLDPHPAVLVGANIVAARSFQTVDADDNRRVRPAYFRLHRGARRAEQGVGWDAHELVAVIAGPGEQIGDEADDALWDQGQRAAERRGSEIGDQGRYTGHQRCG